MMRFSSALTLLCSLAALVLSLLCLFAGSTKSFLQNGELLTLNVSRLGHTSLFNTTDGNGGFFSNLANDIEGDVNQLLSDVSSDIAKALDLSDFYNVHVMDYCEGMFLPNTTGKHAKENVTHCSNRTALFHFDSTAIVKKELPSGVTLEDLHWPSEIEDAAKAISAAATVMFICYVIGIAFSGFAIFGAVYALVTGGRLFAFVNFVLDIFAFLGLAIASTISTIIVDKAVNAINKYGTDIGLAAYKGKMFLGLTWAATALMFVAACMSVAQFFAGRKRSRGNVEKSY